MVKIFPRPLFNEQNIAIKCNRKSTTNSKLQLLITVQLIILTANLEILYMYNQILLSAQSLDCFDHMHLNKICT